MNRRSTISTRTDTLLPYTTLFRLQGAPGRGAAAGAVAGIRARPGLAADRDLGAAAGGVRLHRPGLRRGGLGGAHFRLRVRDRVRAAGAPRHRAAAAEDEGVLGLDLEAGLPEYSLVERSCVRAVAKL